MHRLKDIARRMDNSCERTAWRWIQKLNAQLAALDKDDSVLPDVPSSPGRGGAPNRWHDKTADRIISLWEQFYKTRGTTPQIVRAKYAGDLFDARQLILWPQNTKLKLNTAGSGFSSSKTAGASRAGNISKRR